MVVVEIALPPLDAVYHPFKLYVVVMVAPDVAEVGVTDPPLASKVTVLFAAAAVVLFLEHVGNVPNAEYEYVVVPADHPAYMVIFPVGVKLLLALWLVPVADSSCQPLKFCGVDAVLVVVFVDGLGVFPPLPLNVCVNVEDEVLGL